MTAIIKSCLFIFILLGVIFVGNANAQVLVTAETGGKGSQSLFFTANSLLPEGISFFNANIQYSFGLNNKVDLMVIYGNISAPGLSRNQNYVGIGWNVSLLKRKNTFVDVSFFNTINTPIDERNDASTVLMTPALIVSRPVKIKSLNVILYSGLNSSLPIGSVKNKFFTPPETFLNIPIGITMPIYKKWSEYIEYDYGTNLKSFGLGILKVF